MPQLASAHAPVHPETRVGDFEVAAEAGVRLSVLANSSEHQEKLDASTAKAVGYPHATKGGTALSERAAVAGARYAKQVEQALRMTPQQLQKSIGSFTDNIVKHQGYLKNPQSHVPNWNQLSPQHQQNLIHHWNNDTARASGIPRDSRGHPRGSVKMSAEDTFRHYLVATNELLLEFALEAKTQVDATRGTEAGNFDAGDLMGLHRVISLLQQQAPAFGLEVSDVGLGEIDPDRDLT